MIESYDVKEQKRKSDVIFDSLNRINVAKYTGALKKDELAEVITDIGDLYAGKVKLGKATLDEIESFESYLTGFDGPNAQSYFTFPHEELGRASKTALESIDFAKQDLEQRKQYAQSVMSADSYERTFRRLGH